MLEYYYVISSFLHVCIKFSVCASNNPLHVSHLRFVVRYLANLDNKSEMNET